MRTNLLIVVLALALAAGTGYVAYDSGKSAGVAEARASLNSFLAERTTTGQGGNAQGTPGATRGAGGNPFGALFGGVQGTVDKVEGNTLSVTVTRGQQIQSVKVTVAGTAAVQQITPASLSDIKAGSRVIVGADQSQAGGGQAQQIPSEIAARSIMLLPANFGP